MKRLPDPLRISILFLNVSGVLVVEKNIKVARYLNNLEGTQVLPEFIYLAILKGLEIVARFLW
jgi:hypothetical protein